MPEDDTAEVDIFTSLLNEVSPKPAKLRRVAESPLDPVTLSIIQSVDSAYVVDDMLIAFTRNDNCCSLNIWKPISYTTHSTLPIYSPQPNAVVSHTSSVSVAPCKRSDTIPYLAVSPSSAQQREGVVLLASDLFNYLFGCEMTLSRSLVIVYGCQCGLVHGCSVKRLPNIGITNQQKLICALDQPVLSLYPLSLSNETAQSAVKDSLLFIGMLGKIILIKTMSSSVSTQEVLINGPLLSTLLIPQHALLLSNLTTVQLICLKCYNECRDDSALLVTLFEQPLTVLHSPHYLLFYNKVNSDYFMLLGLRPEGYLCTIKLPVDYTQVLQLQTEGNISDQMKRTLKSIEETSVVAKQLDADIEALDTDLITLNEVCNLFGDQLDQQSLPPLNVEMGIIYEHLDVMTRQPFLNVSLSLLGGSTPLKRGCFISIEMRSGTLGRSTVYLSPWQQRTGSHTCSLSIQALSSNKPLDLKLIIPQDFLTHFQLKVSCCLSFSSPVTSGTRLLCKKSLAIPLCNKSFTLLDFIQPVRHNHTLVSGTDRWESITLRIKDSTIQDYLHQHCHDQSISTSVFSSPLSLSLIELLGTHTSRRSKVSECLVSTKDCHGNQGFELLAVLPDNSVVQFMFHVMPSESLPHNESKYSLCIKVTTLLLAVQLSDVISQVL